jgi:hypothetical protein
MPTDERPGRKGVYVELPLELLEEVRRLAEANGRGFRDEVQHALERHLAAPPTVRVVIDTPDLPPAEVEVSGGQVTYGSGNQGVGHHRPSPAKRGKAKKKT